MICSGFFYREHFSETKLCHHFATLYDSINQIHCIN
uniref:Uncharacterized protein n=1 Tax=Siphoviridae sp. ctsYb1 TaxID=2825696 RepID=A0A8S5VI96_9CAUD|nr:MAG TPA: hypothetical protein [Siphoviridae sp. ctsYb1]